MWWAGVMIGLLVGMAGMPAVVSASPDLLTRGVRGGVQDTASWSDVPEGERLILAFYYASFDWDTWSRPLCGQPDTLYVSADASAVEQHVREARDAGLDGLIQAWYGPALAQNPTEPNFQTLLAAGEQAGLDVAVLLDMTDSLLGTTEAVIDALVKVRDDHGQHPAYLTVGGRPVLFFRGQDAFSMPTWEAIRNQVDPEHTMIWIAAGGPVEVLEIFDGLYLYNIAQTDEPSKLLADWSSKVRLWGLEHATQRYWVATAMPGYDDTATAPEDETLVRTRRGGAYYRETWSAAVSSGPDWIVIRSLNGWPACTQIEPSEAEGDLYLDLTGELIAQDGEPAQPTETPTPTATSVTVTPTATLPPVTPTLTPTVAPSPTPRFTPTVTLTPSATPFRLSTPTPLPGQAPPAGSPTDAPSNDGESPRQPTGPGGAPAGPGMPATPTVTPIPRLPVEGYSPRRCSLLPLLLPLGAAVLARRRRSTSFPERWR
jgi:hypothetical protein